MVTLSNATVFVFLGLIIGVIVCRGLLRNQHRQITRLVGEDSIDVAEHVVLGGVRQWVTIRGRDKRKPVLLFLHGGPGSAFSGLAYSFQIPWEEFFTVVNWDQRGAGRSNVDKAGVGKNVQFEQIVSDAVELIEHLAKRLGHEKIFVLGHSWGAYVGLTLARHHPKQLHAYVGLGQLTGLKRNCEAIYRIVLDEARKRDDHRTIKKLEQAGSTLPGPETDFLKWIGTVTGPLARYGMSWHNQNSMGKLFGRILTMAFVSPNLSLSEIFSTLGASKAYARSLFSSIYHSSLPEDLGEQFETPIVFVSGKHDNQTPIELVQNYFNEISAPEKQMHVLEDSAHVALWEEPGHILDILVNSVLPLTKNTENR